jgi:hypothetical protein
MKLLALENALNSCNLILTRRKLKQTINAMGRNPLSTSHRGGCLQGTDAQMFLMIKRTKLEIDITN